MKIEKLLYFERLAVKREKKRPERKREKKKKEKKRNQPN